MKYTGVILFLVIVAAIFVAANYDSLFGADNTVVEPESPAVDSEPVEEVIEEDVSEQEAVEEEPVVVIEDQVESEVESLEEAAEEAAKEETAEDTPQTFKEFLDSAEKSYAGYGYWVDEVLTGPFGIVERDGVILLNFQRIQNLADDTLDTVLLYRSNQTAIGTCVGIGCASSKDKVFSVDFDKYNPETMLDAVQEYHTKKVVLVKDSVLISDFDSNIVELQNGVKIHVGKKTHFPLMIQDKDGKKLKEVHGFFYESSQQEPLTFATKSNFPFD